MDDGIEMVLQVDALAQTICTDEHPFFGLGQMLDPLFAFGRRQQACHRNDLNALEPFAQFGGHIFGGRDEAAEQDGMEAVLDEGRDQLVRLSPS
jgi:hypothetical protein